VVFGGRASDDVGVVSRSRSAAPAGAAGRNQPAGKGRGRAAVYLRVSTEGQLDGTSIDTQRAHCQDLAARHGLTLVSEHVDAGVSGATDSRPALDELLAAATAGDIDVVIVAKLDRLSRSLLHLLELLEKMDALGVRVLSATDGIDTRTPAGRLMLQLLGVFAEFERERIRERSQDGHRRRAQAGGFVGTTPPFGYRAAPDPGGAGFVLAIDQTAAACIRAMYQLLVRQTVDQTDPVPLGPRRRTHHRHRHLALARPAGPDPAHPHHRAARRMDGLAPRHRQTRPTAHQLPARRTRAHPMRAVLPRPHRR
jgi:site-specific DNA recombinase